MKNRSKVRQLKYWSKHWLTR